MSIQVSKFYIKNINYIFNIKLYYNRIKSNTVNGKIFPKPLIYNSKMYPSSNYIFTCTNQMVVPQCHNRQQKKPILKWL